MGEWNKEDNFFYYYLRLSMFMLKLVCNGWIRSVWIFSIVEICEDNLVEIFKYIKGKLK